MSLFFKRIRLHYRQLRFRIRSIFKGQSLSSLQTSFTIPQASNPRQKISLRYQSYPQLNNYFMQFVNSAESSGRVNGQNLAFLIGPEGAGKSSYVQSNLQRFKHAKQGMANKSKGNLEPQVHKYKSPQFLENQTKETVFDNQHYLVFNFDYSNNKALNFRSFFTDIHERIIEQILRLNKRFNGGLIDCQTIKQVLMAQNSPQYLYMYVKDIIYCILEDIDPIFITENGKKELEELNQTINQGKVQASQFFEKDGLYRRLIDILAKNMNVSQTEAALKLFLSIGKRIQYEHRPQTHKNTWYETGIQSTNILFDILNFICGFGKLNKQSFDQYFFQGGYLKTPQKQDKKIKQIEGSMISRGDRIDVAIFFTNLDSLYIYDSPQFWSFIDHIISRAANNSSLRNHFPIMIEFPNYTDFQEVHNMGQFNITSPVVIELPGYTLHQLRLSNANVAQLFTEQVLIQLFFRLGRNPRTWHKAIQEMQKGTKIDDIIKSKAQYILKDNIGLQARVNNLYTSPQLLSQISDNSIRYELIQHLRLIKKADGMIFIHRPALMIDFFSRPIWRELVKQNIAYTHFYLPYLDISDLPNTVKLNDLKNYLLKGHIWGFLKWQLNNIGRLGIYRRQIHFRRGAQKQSYHLDDFRKQRPDPHLAQTYYGAIYNYMFYYKQKGIVNDLIQ